MGEASALAQLLGLVGVEIDVVEPEADGSWSVHVTTAAGLPAVEALGIRLLGQVEGRAKADVVDWLAAQDPAWLAGIRYVTTGLSWVYKSAVTTSGLLPNARLVADLFHVIQLANTMLGDVRRRVTHARYRLPIHPPRMATHSHNQKLTTSNSMTTTYGQVRRASMASVQTTSPRDQLLSFIWKVLLTLGPIRIFDNPYRPRSGALSAVDAPIKRGQSATPR